MNMRRALPITLILCLLSITAWANFAPVVDAWHQSQHHSDFFRVRQGDTLYSIAWAFNLDYRALAAANGLKPPFALAVGQQIKMISQKESNQFKAKTKHNLPATQNHQYTAIKPATQKHHPTQKHHIPQKQHAFSHKPIRSWSWPAKGKVAGRGKNWTTQKGIDILGHYGEPIRATTSGMVVYTGAGVRGYGQLIIIKHNNNYLSAYAFNKKILVKENAWVNRGQAIAQMGKNNGTAMLHFEIRHNGRSINPIKLLRKYS